MSDPVFVKAISIGLGLMFMAAAYHKLSVAAQFRITLLEYQVLPEALVPLTSRLVPVVEILLGGAWLAGYAGNGLTAVGTALLLGIYALAIGINIARGRVHFDCGCGFGGRHGNEQSLSGKLIVRNLVLIAAALYTLVPVNARDLGPGDYLTLLATLLAGGLLFGAANQLIANRAAIDTWRKRR